MSTVFAFVNEHNGISAAENRLAAHSQKAIESVDKLQTELEGRFGIISPVQVQSLDCLRSLAVFVGKRKS